MPDAGLLRAYIRPQPDVWLQCFVSLQLVPLSPLLFPSWECFCLFHSPGSVKAWANKTHPCNYWVQLPTAMSLFAFVRDRQKATVPLLSVPAVLSRRNVLHSAGQVGTAQKASTACAKPAQLWVSLPFFFVFLFLVVSAFHMLKCVDEIQTANVSNPAYLQGAGLQSRVRPLPHQHSSLVNILVLPCSSFPSSQQHSFRSTSSN